MDIIEKQLLKFKNLFENSILEGGLEGKKSIIRSGILINLIHEGVKKEFIKAGINPKNIYPPLGKSKPELNLTGFFKQKKQDICIAPSNIEKVVTPITWGPLAYENKVDSYGFEYSTNTLSINIRSQLSSVGKNTDTLFERTLAEALNLHLCYPDIILGEVFLIPLYEYDENLMKNHKIGFKDHPINIAKYIAFFSEINNVTAERKPYAYERCALLIVDFNRPIPYLFKNTIELKAANYLPPDFEIEYSTLNFKNFVSDILKEYSLKHNINNIL